MGPQRHAVGSVVVTGTAAYRESDAGRQRPGWLRRHSAGFYAIIAAAPAILFLLVLYIVPMAMLFWQSVAGGTLENYHRALTDDLYVGVLVDTLLIAGYAAGICLVLGYPVAYLLASASNRWAAIGILFVLLPFWTSVLVRTYGWMVLLGRNGVINQALLEIGLISQPLALLNNTTGVLIGLVHVLLPYMIFPLYAVMRRMDSGLVAAAQGLGASGLQTFLRVYFPLTLPGVLAGVTLVYVLSIGFYITPALLGGGRVAMMATLIEQQVRTFLNWGFAAALSAVLLVVTLLVYVLLRRLLRGNMEWS